MITWDIKTTKHRCHFRSVSDVCHYAGGNYDNVCNHWDCPIKVSEEYDIKQ